MIMSGCIHFAANGINSLFFLWLSSMYHIFFIHLSVSGHLGCLPVLAIMSSAALDIGVHHEYLFIDFFWLCLVLTCSFLFSFACCGFGQHFTLFCSVPQLSIFV